MRSSITPLHAAKLNLWRRVFLAAFALGTALLAPANLHAEEAHAGPCYARWTPDRLIVGNNHFERTWVIDGDLLRPVSFIDRDTKTEWLSGPTGKERIPAPPKLTITPHSGTFSPVEAPSLALEITADKNLRFEFQIFAEAHGVEVNVQPVLSSSAPAKKDASGILEHDNSKSQGGTPTGGMDDLSLQPLHLRLTQVTLTDATDRHNQLVNTRDWMFMNNEEDIVLHGNLFYVEDVITSSGLIFLKQAPLPEGRYVNQSDPDLRVLAPSRTFRFSGTGYPSTVLSYTGGRTGRIAALQTYQRQIRTYVPGRDATFLSNTWGDRNRDTRINADFVSKEIAAGAKLGVDVVQIDDGWQQGRSINSARGPGTAIGFWTSATSGGPRFWDVDPGRFPAGIDPLVAASKASGMRLGLWYAPDSSNNFANWQLDANLLLEFYKKYGISNFKFDSIHTFSALSETNLRQLFHAILKGSNGAITIDLDLTGDSRRPSYFGSINSGPLFVENRYSDYHRYWPHLTLRNLWQLSEFVDPLRLRMEFLNNTRALAPYVDPHGIADPLAPASYTPDTLFATVMFSNPLGWFETSNLTPEFTAAAAPLVKTWKQQRNDLFTGTIIPIGQAPDGVVWTGFASISSPKIPSAEPTSGTVLVFRELNDSPDWSTPILLHPGAIHRVRVLAGQGTATLEGNTLNVHIPQKLQYVWLRLD